VVDVEPFSSGDFEFAGIEAELHVFEACTHIMFIGAPEAEERSRELRHFINKHWQR